MRTESIALKGITRFTDEVRLDFRAIPPGLVAIVGGNGNGKTTLLETGVGTLLREFPSRGGVVNYATGPDSFMEFTFTVEGQGTYRARVNLNGIKRLTDAVLLEVQPDGAEVPLNDGKATTYDAVIKERFPSKELILASAFSAQGRQGNFIGLKPAARRTLFGEMLGIAHLEAKSQTAVAAAARVASALQPLRTEREMVAPAASADRLEALIWSSGDVEQQAAANEAERVRLTAEVAEAEARLAGLGDSTAAVTAATAKVETARAALAKLKADTKTIAERHAAVIRAIDEDRAAVVMARDERLADLDKRIAGNQQLLGMAEEIRAAATAVAALNAELATARPEHDAALTALDAAERTLRDAEHALAALAPVKKDVTRAKADAELLGQVPCHGDGEYAGCQFLLNAAAAQARIAELESLLAPKAALADRVAEAVRAADTARARVDGLKRAISTATVARATHDKAKYAESLAVAEAKVEEYQNSRTVTLQESTGRIQTLDARRAEVVGARDADATAMAGQLEHAEAAVTTAEAEIAALSDKDAAEKGARVALASARRAWEDTITRAAAIEANRQDLAIQRRSHADAVARLADVDARIETLGTELIEWQQLAKVLSRDGLQTLEIDAAAPTISGLANQILESCFGPRFSLEVVTQTARADGKGLKEEFTVKVTDNERGGEPRDIGDLSGGESVIVSEALMAAIAIYVNQRSPLPLRTCARDETTGALDPENARRYGLMLRKLHELGGFHHLIFITHNPEVAALADVQIHVAGGTATVHEPPFPELATQEAA